MSNSHLPRIAITPGEPAGIGPELVVRLAQQSLAPLEIVAVADPDLLHQAAQQLALPLSLTSFDPAAAHLSGQG